MRLAALIAVWLAGAAAWVPQSRPTYIYQRAGSTVDRAGAPRGGFALMGGGTDLDSAFQWMCRRAGSGDFLVLRASGTDAYNRYIQKLCPRLNSVATLIISSRAAAETPFVAARIREAAAIFLSGGDQSQYVNWWQHTPVQHELNAAIRRGVPVGGTSAGLAVLGEYAYSAQSDKPDGPNLTSAAALANPFDPQVVLVRRFLTIPALAGVVTDTHFHARRRLGRLLVFMARILAAHEAQTMHGIGIDQHTALLVDPDGHAVAAGTGAVYLLSASGAPVVCRADAPLSFGPLAVRRLTAGQRFDLATWSGSGARYSLSVRAGRITSSQAGGSPY